ncbi:MAG: A/G-specific adenine glycosylase [Rubrivivax sp.]
MPEALTPPPPASLAQRVVDWQRLHGRHGLPWQGTRDPYRVWLSEVMLQQTQVSTVLGYYERFLQRFPDVTALAQAPVDEVLALWSGLGYYSRARHLHRCAQAVAQTHGGVFPRDSATLQTLPGIGPSTAAAIAAFCHGERAAILDGNVKRVLTRALGHADDLAVPAHERALWRKAEALLPDSADMPAYTQGLMDLGAQVCTVRRPSCLICPLHEDCVARRLDRPQDFPVKTRRLKRSRRTSTLLWLCLGPRLWLTRRPEQGVWAGLWSLPEWPAERADGVGLPAWPGLWHALPPIEHALTHLDWTLQPLRWTLPQDLTASARASIEQAVGPGRWCSRDEALALGLPAPVRRLLLDAASGERNDSTLLAG